MKWTDIKDYEGLYQISKTLLKVRNSKGKILNAWLNSDGYYQVGLYKNGKLKGFRVHRLLALHFVKGRTEEKNEVNHKNGIKTDIRIKNLEWGTHGHNQQHAWDTGLKKRNLNTDHWNSIPIICKDIVTGAKTEYGSLHEAARQLAMKVPRIWISIKRGTTSNKKYKFYYSTESITKQQ